MTLRPATPTPRGSLDPQGGFTLIEMMVAIIILSIFMALVSTAVVQMVHATLKTQAVGDSQFQLDTAFLRLDREVRYASAINPPGQTGSDWYVEFLTTNTGTAQCTQLRFDPASRLLQQRTWTSTGAPVPTPPWVTLAAGIVNNPTTQPPFTFTPSGTALVRQQLGIWLFSASGPGVANAVSTTSLTFSALNSSPSSVTNTAGKFVCTEVARS
ncbi:MAG: prepilin-type N-terminal cleavage/methylation domain-containing protein [Mycobacteriales bacterium]